MQVVHTVVPQQKDEKEPDQTGKSSKRPTTGGGSKKGATSKRLKPKNKSNSDDQRPATARDAGVASNPNQRGSKGGNASNHPARNLAVPGAGRLQGKGKRNRGHGVGRGGGRPDFSPGVVPDENAGHLPQLKLGPPGGCKRKQQQRWELAKTPEALTDLSQQKYSVPWLLQRRDNKDVQECYCDLPSPLSRRLLSPDSQKRRYPFNSTGTTQQTTRGGHNNQNESVPAWMNEQSENLEGDFNFQVLGIEDKEHWEKFGTVKDMGDIRVLSIADYEREDDRRKKVNTEKQQSVEEKEQYMINPVTQEDIFQAFTGNTLGETGTGDQEGTFNPDDLFASEPIQPPRKVADGLGREGNASSQLKGQKQSTQQIPSGKEDNFLLSFMKDVKPPKLPGVGLPLPESTTPSKPLGQDNSMMYALEHGRRRRPANPAKLPTPISRPSTTDVRGKKHQHRVNPNSRHEPQQHQRVSNSALTDAEREQLTQMLHERLQKYSVSPSELAYASRSASKALKLELTGLGYMVVPSPNLNDASLTKKDKAVLSFQHEIRKQYHIAIYRANNEANRNKHHYRDCYMKLRDKKLRHPR